MLAQTLLIWTALWLSGGGLFVLLVRRGVTYVHRFWLTAVFFLGLSALVGLPFYDVLRPRLSDLRVMHLVIMVGVVLVQIAVHAWARKSLPRPLRFIGANPHIYFLRMDYRYLVSKPFEILFQQTMLASLVFVLAAAGLSMYAIVGVSLGLFALSHLFFFWLLGRFFGRFYLACATVAGAVFPILMLRVEGGIFYSYVAHWFFYTAAGVSFWLFLARRAVAQSAPKNDRVAML